MVNEERSLSDVDREYGAEATRISIESQSKFTYFMLGLTFAILGLSIQITDQNEVTHIILLSWVILLISAVGGTF